MTPENGEDPSLEKKGEISKESWHVFKTLYNELLAESMPFIRQHDEALKIGNDEALERTAHKINETEERFKERVLNLAIKFFVTVAQSGKWKRVGFSPPTPVTERAATYAFQLDEGFELDLEYVKSYPTHDGTETYREEGWTLTISPPESGFSEWGSNVLDNFSVHIDVVPKYPDPTHMITYPDMSRQQEWSLASAIRQFKLKHSP